MSGSTDLIGWYVIAGPIGQKQTIECVNWCRAHLKTAHWEYRWNTGMFSFRNEADAVMFKLVFDYGSGSGVTQQGLD